MAAALAHFLKHNTLDVQRHVTESVLKKLCEAQKRSQNPKRAERMNIMKLEPNLILQSFGSFEIAFHCLFSFSTFSTENSASTIVIHSVSR